MKSDEGCRLLLAFADPRAASHFLGTSWMAAAIKAAGIEIVVVAPPESVRAEVAVAQELQYR
ncbi:MAG: hypothetical protein AB7I38_13460 [Dehalococcoidia bacterium]